MIVFNLNLTLNPNPSPSRSINSEPYLMIALEYMRGTVSEKLRSSMPLSVSRLYRSTRTCSVIVVNSSPTYGWGSGLELMVGVRVCD